MVLDGYESKEQKAWYKVGVVSATIANCHRSKDSKPFEPEDFIPKKKVEQTPEQQLAVIKMLNAAFGGEVI